MKELNTIDRFLPIGSVVVLNEGKRPVMISSRLTIHFETNKLYDYSGVPYPEGTIQNNQSLFFNHGEIRLLLFRGYEDEMEMAFKAVLNKMEKTRLIKDNDKN